MSDEEEPRLLKSPSPSLFRNWQKNLAKVLQSDPGSNGWKITRSDSLKKTASRLGSDTAGVLA